MFSTFKRITQRSGGANISSDNAQKSRLGDALRDIGESDCWLIIKVKNLRES
jgi:hypothetical protein